jgi:hypothetical protein
MRYRSRTIGYGRRNKWFPVSKAPGKKKIAVYLIL